MDLKVIALLTFSGGKQDGRLPLHCYSNPLINPDYSTADQLAVKSSVFNDHIVIGWYLLDAQSAINTPW